MSSGPRQTGGQNNKRGNRYEDCFATFKLLEGVADLLDLGRSIRLREQVNASIDDLLVETLDKDYFHQLKSGQQTSWGLRGGKLEKEFLDQKNDCEARKQQNNRDYKLVIVVPSNERRSRLEDSMPIDLKAVTSVVVFPQLSKPHELVRQHSEASRILTNISAKKTYSESEAQIIVSSVYAAWIDHKPDRDGFCCLDKVIKTIQKSFVSCRIRTDWKRKPKTWKEAQAVLAKIPGFTWSVGRGYFEWEHAPAEQGMMQFPCKSENFRRFIDRIIDTKPTNFDDLWMQFP